MPPAVSLYVLSFLHLVWSHAGKNSLLDLYKASFYSYNATKYAGTCVRACFHCQMYNSHTGRPNCPPNRHIRANSPNELAYLDIVSIDSGIYKGKKYTDLLAIMDSFSHYCSVLPIENQKTSTIVSALKNHWYSFPVPVRCHFDNYLD